MATSYLCATALAPPYQRSARPVVRLKKSHTKLSSIRPATAVQLSGGQNVVQSPQCLSAAPLR